MKKEILKIAGVKSEKEFYKKFPDEASFMKAHGKEFKKAMRANKVDKAQVGRQLPSAREMSAQLRQDYPLASVPDIGKMMKPVGVPTAATKMKGAVGSIDTSNFAPYAQAAGDVFGGLMDLGQQKQDVAGAEQRSKLTGVQKEAIASRPIQPVQRQYVRPEDVVYQPEQMFPSYGVGTNVLAQDGAVINQIGGNPTEIMNTFAPNTIYSDMGYEPLSDSDKVKQYYHGGVHKAKGGQKLSSSDFGQFMTGGGGNILGMGADYLTATEGYQDVGSRVGGGIGQAAGMAIAGPVGAMLGKFAGKLIGDVIDPADEQIAKFNEQSQQNMGEIMGSQAGLRFQNQFSAFVKDGGNIPKAQPGKDLTKKDGKCEAEESRNKEYAAMDKAASRDLKALGKEVAAAERQAARQSAQEMEDYLSEGLTGYGEKIKKKDFETAYQAFAAQNPELAKDRLLYTLANKELNKLKRNPQYLMRNVLGKVDPNLDYNALTLPQLMQTMQRGFGSGQGYYDAWKEGFPARTYTMPQLTPIQQQENGGQTSEYEWVSHTWQPQKIAFFGEHKLSDLLKPPADADMLRAGGEIRNLRKNYMSPEEEMMTNMAFGGQLKTTWGGHAEPISHNPHMPATGQTIEFYGQTHDQKDKKGRTGIGVKYGDHDSYTDYAEYGTEADADVEVEKGEPAVELPNGDGDNSMVVYGNLKIPNQFLSEIGDPKAKGKKFKTYVKDLAKKEQRQNKIIDKASEQLDDLNPISPFDRLKFNSLAANIEGANMKLKEYAEFKQNAAAVQNAINDTAEEMGLDADKLAKGKVAMAKQGANVPKAQDGRRNRARVTRESTLRQFNPAASMPTVTFLPQGLITPTEPVVSPAAATAQVSAPAASTRRTATSTQTDDGGYKSKYGLKPWPGNVTGLGKKTASSFSAQEWDEIADRLGFKGYGNKEFQEFLWNNPESRPIIEARHKKLYNKTPSEDPELIDNKLGYGWAADELKKLVGIPKTGMDLGKAYKGFPELKPVVPKLTGPGNVLKPVMPPTKVDNTALINSILGQAMQYLRPSDVEALDPMQLAGEMFALSQNVVEPVWAQKLTPRLSTPIDISLQDILNENRATLRRQQQILGYNPAAQSAFAAQEYGANQRVLGEQFRLNQAEKQRVYEQNRNILNQYDLANMGILDKQYERQATALSKTKATTQAALNSIASKIGQNKLENRTLATYENLYNYRFDPRFRAQNYQLAQFNIPTVGSSTTSTAKTGKKVDKKEQRNSSIVKALKNL